MHILVCPQILPTMTFKPHFWTITILSLILVTFRVSHFPVSHLTHKTVKLCLQNTLNMSKTTRVYFGVLHARLPPARPSSRVPTHARLRAPLAPRACLAPQRAQLPCPWSQYTQVYCDTISLSQASRLQHKRLYCNTVLPQPASSLQYNIYCNTLHFPAVYCNTPSPSSL